MNQNHFFVLTAGIIILALVSGGYSGTPSPSNDPSIPVGTPTESSTPAATETPVETPEPTVEPTVEPTEAWWDEEDYFIPTTIPADDTLFGVNIEGIKYDKPNNWYDLFDDNKQLIFQHNEYTPSTLHLEHDLPQEQYEALIDSYGRPEEVIFEKYDSTGDGELDKVAVKYEGTGGKVLEFEMDYKEGSPLYNYIYLELKEK